MRGAVYVRGQVRPVESIGVDMVREARRHEREKVLLELRRKVVALETTRASRTYGTDAIKAEEFKKDALAAIDGMLEGGHDGVS